MSEMPSFVVSVVETYERYVDVKVGADTPEDALEEALSAYIDTNAAIGSWSENEKTGIRVELVHG